MATDRVEATGRVDTEGMTTKEATGKTVKVEVEVEVVAMDTNKKTTRKRLLLEMA